MSDPEWLDAAMDRLKEVGLEGAALWMERKAAPWIAIDERTPLLERVRFLGIFSSNLDEFVMKRVWGLKRQAVPGVVSRTTRRAAEPTPSARSSA